jgi:hypothetical protein
MYYYMSERFVWGGGVLHNSDAKTERLQAYLPKKLLNFLSLFLCESERSQHTPLGPSDLP